MGYHGDKEDLKAGEISELLQWCDSSNVFYHAHVADFPLPSTVQYMEYVPGLVALASALLLAKIRRQNISTFKH